MGSNKRREMELLLGRPKGVASKKGQTNIEKMDLPKLYYPNLE